jgi:hypothetical protein
VARRDYEAFVFDLFVLPPAVRFLVPTRVYPHLWAQATLQIASDGHETGYLAPGSTVLSGCSSCPVPSLLLMQPTSCCSCQQPHLTVSSVPPVTCPACLCSEETRCRFCNNVLPDWRPTLTPPALKPTSSVMSVRYRGVTHRITYTPGPDGLDHFLQTLQSIGIKVASASQVTFLCRSPDTGVLSG